MPGDTKLDDAWYGLYVRMPAVSVGRLYEPGPSVTGVARCGAGSLRELKLEAKRRWVELSVLRIVRVVCALSYIWSTPSSRSRGSPCDPKEYGCDFTWKKGGERGETVHFWPRVPGAAVCSLRSAPSSFDWLLCAKSRSAVIGFRPWLRCGRWQAKEDSGRVGSVTQVLVALVLTHVCCGGSYVPGPSTRARERSKVGDPGS